MKIRQAPQEQPKHTISNIMPASIVSGQQQQPLLAGLWVSATGHFPNAKGHIWERTQAEADTYLIIYCLKGRGWFCADGRKWAVGPGDLAVAMVGIAHSYRADADDPWTIQWAHFHGEDAPRLLAMANAPVHGGVINLGFQTTIFAAFNDMLNTLHTGYSQQHLLVAAACLRYILSRVAFTTTHSSSTKSGRAVELVIDFMREHLEQRYSLNEFAAQANMPRSTFIRVFRTKTGYAPVEYFLRLKVQRACELLETTDLQINQISRKLGYEDQYYFSRLFKKFMDLSPQQYRQ